MIIRTFAEYEEGFTVGNESWLGLKQLAELTKVVVTNLFQKNVIAMLVNHHWSLFITQEGEWQLKVEFTPWGSNETKIATYRPFSVGPAPRFKIEKRNQQPSHVGYLQVSTECWKGKIVVSWYG